MIKQEILLTEIKRGVQMLLTDKFARVICDSEYKGDLKARMITTIASALGESLGEVRYPTYWQRFLKRKDCPNYMKDITVNSIIAYYPKLSLPDEPHWLVFAEKAAEKTKSDEERRG